MFQVTSGLIPVEGTSLSQISQPWGKQTGLSVLDDFLPWQGLPSSGITLLEGPQANRLARKLVMGQEEPERSLWVHAMNQRPFFQESKTCFRLQVPQDVDVFQVLPEVLADSAFSNVIVQVTTPVSRAKAAEILEQVRRLQTSVLFVCKYPRLFPVEFSDLVIEASDEFVTVKKAQNRPVPLWIPVEMLDSRIGHQEGSVVSWWNAIESFPG